MGIVLSTMLRVLSQSARRCLHSRVPNSRLVSTSAGEVGTAQENAMREKIEGAMTTEFVSVTDVSGGCGSMYNVYVASDEFKGVPLIKQHKQVTGILAEDIADMHGLTVKTKTVEKHKKEVAKQQAN